jgi:recombination protein RecR
VAALPESLTLLIAELGKLPGIGPRSAERLALHLVQSDKNSARQLAQTLVEARDRIQSCQQCGALTEQQPCAICQDAHRDRSLICLVERPVDILSIEKSGTYRGLYHVLGGKISPVNGIGPDDLRITELERRLRELPPAEVIIALGSDVEGDATSHYLAKRLASFGIKLTRLAHGLPVGSSLEFADELTLSRAIEGRRALS